MFQRLAQAGSRLFSRARGIQFNIDQVDLDCVAGWARCTRRPGHHPLVELRSDGRTLARSSAGTLREDLLQAGIGDGCYGFSLYPGISVFSNSAIPVEILIDGEVVHRDVIEPRYDEALNQFARDMESRMDALLALTRERQDREWSARIEQLQD